MDKLRAVLSIKVNKENVYTTKYRYALVVLIQPTETFLTAR